MTAKEAGILAMHRQHCVPTFLLILVLGVLGCANQADAQQVPPTSVTDGVTPAGVEPGSPAGAYPLSGFDTINYFNGKLNVALPLLEVGGRGQAHYQMTLLVEQLWSLETVCSPSVAGQCPATTFTASDTGRTGPPLVYTPGIVYGRDAISASSIECTTGVKSLTTISSVSRFTFVEPDGTEHEMVDTILYASPSGNPNFCAATPAGQHRNRGRVFVSTDGAGLTFISDRDVIDQYPMFSGSSASTPAVPISVTGKLLFRDGTMYQIGNCANPNDETTCSNEGQVTRIRDRNGNQITLTYDPATFRLQQVVDSLNRTITITPTWTFDPVNQFNILSSETITFPGYQSASRQIVVNYAKLGQVLRASYLSQPTSPACDYGDGTLHPGLRSLVQLFPESTILQFGFQLLHENGCYESLEKVASVILPNQRKYEFQYNSYGEVARVDLPTGGAIEYDIDAGEGANSTSGATVSGPPYILYRRVKQRRAYVQGGVDPSTGKHTGGTLDAITAISSTLSIPTGSNCPVLGGAGSAMQVTVEHQDALGNPLAADVHCYLQWPTTLPSSIPTTTADWRQGREYQTDHRISANGIFLHSETRSWAETFPDGTVVPAASAAFPPTAYSNTIFNPEVVQADTILADATQATKPVSRKTFSFDVYNNATNVSEFDYGAGAPGPLLRQTHTVYVTDPRYTADAVHLVSLPSTVTISGPVGATSSTQYEYDCYGGTCSGDGNHVGLVDRTGIVQFDSGYSLASGNLTRGNVTQVKRTLDTPFSIVSSWQQYDIAGNVVASIDANNNPTKVDYAANGNTYGFATTITNALNHTRQIGYDVSLGKPTSIGRWTSPADSAPGSTNVTYQDALDRPDRVSFPDGGSRMFLYDDVNVRVTASAVQNSCSLSQSLITDTQFDGLGRKSATVTHEDGNTIRIDQKYDGMGRIAQVSNPYRPGDTQAWTVTSYDGLSRPAKILLPDGQSIAYNIFAGNQVLARDPASTWRLSQTDALGRQTQVIEDPSLGGVTAVDGITLNNSGMNLTTNYGYDGLDNLTIVCQGGAIVNSTSCSAGQKRSFQYDSLKRLIQATNPETGSISYNYDPQGNLTSKTDQRPLTVSLGYDALNRIKQKSYSDATPPVFSCYDGQIYSNGQCANAVAPLPNAFATGRLTQVFNSASSSSFPQYDLMGRPLQSVQTTAGTPYPFFYTYNLAGGLENVTYPSKRALQTCYDSAARTVNATGTLAGQPTAYVASATYAPHGGIQMLKRTYAPGAYDILENTTYNSRLQPASIELMKNGTSQLKLENFYCAGLALTCNNNNGNMLAAKITTSAPLQVTQSFGYDKLNRLTNAAEGAAWTEAYGYDPFGNRWVTQTGAGLPALPGYVPMASSWYSDPNQGSPTFKPVPDNRISGHSYDNAGNVSQDGVRGFTYDGENRLATAAISGMPPIAYAYDGEGRRIQKTIGTTTTTFVYDAGGTLAAEYGPPSDTGTDYLTADHLGSTRLVTDASGAVKKLYDYFPFGEDIPTGVSGRSNLYATSTYPSNPDAVSQKFSGKERDAETGLDWFGSRYLSSMQGRFTSPDRLIMKQEWLSDPQRWNYYAYVRNNPLRYIDPNGEDLVVYYSLGGDVSDADRKWFEKNKKAVLNAIQAKFEKAGVKNVSLVDQATLTKSQIAALDKNSPLGVSRLTFVGKDYPGMGPVPQLGVLGYSNPDSKRLAAVFLDTFPKQAPESCDQACIAANVGAHELGHTIGMDHGSTYDSVKEFFRVNVNGGEPDLMTGSQGVPSRSLDFYVGRESTRRAIDEVNRVNGNKTPQPQ
jgi:RHS repeat-associated protein